MRCVTLLVLKSWIANQFLYALHRIAMPQFNIFSSKFTVWVFLVARNLEYRAVPLWTLREGINPLQECTVVVKCRVYTLTNLYML